MAEGGTLFLDEIGDLPLELQPKLLNVLQDREFFRVGSNKAITAKVRVIAATIIDLEEKVRRREFREDLFYRLNVILLNVPPLRERPEDIDSLVRHFLDQLSQSRDFLSNSIKMPPIKFELIPGLATFANWRMPSSEQLHSARMGSSAPQISREKS